MTQDGGTAATDCRGLLGSWEQRGGATTGSSGCSRWSVAAGDFMVGWAMATAQGDYGQDIAV